MLRSCIRDFRQTSDLYIGYCEFVFRRKRYHGIGCPVCCSRLVPRAYRYKWDIFDDSNRFLFSIGTQSAQEPIKRLLTRYLCRTE